MIKLSNKISIKQVIKATNNKTNETNYLILDEKNNLWEKISEDEYNKIRGKENE